MEAKQAFDTDALIVGAGPSGLTTALPILFHDPKIRVTIVDALEAGQNDSRAITVHARTMEALSSIDVSDGFVRDGIHSPAAIFVDGPQDLATVGYSYLTKLTAYPYLNLISQARTEKLLREKLESYGVRVLRPFKLVGIKDSEEGLKALFENQAVITAKYLIGADGSKSSIRQLANIEFLETDFFGRPIPLKKGETRDSSQAPVVILVDAEFIPESLPDIRIQDFVIDLAQDGFFMMSPFIKDGVEGGPTHIRRVAFQVPKHIEEQIRAADNDDFLNAYITTHLKYAQGSRPYPPTVSKIIWKSIFRVRFAVAAKTHTRMERSGGHLLLVGDAAHVHSPAGGQGMNLGIRDGVDVGKSIAAHYEYKDDSILIDCARRRAKLASRVIRVTKILNWIWTVNSPRARAFRDLVMRFLDRVPGFRRKFAMILGGLDDKYL